MISKSLQIIVQILLSTGGTSLEHTRSALTPKLKSMKFGANKLETSLYRAVGNVYRYLNCVGVAHEYDRQTARQTDRPLAIACLTALGAH